MPHTITPSSPGSPSPPVRARYALAGGAGASAEAEIEVKRSRFLCRITRVTSEEAARGAIEAARRAHRTARHHCSAFILEGRDGALPIARTSDDGEPSGTAGRPMLDVLEGAHLVDTAAVVTRYFGGTLLGAGGLVRAYSGAVEAALTTARLVAREERDLVRVAVPHADAGRVEAEFRRSGFEISSIAYRERALIDLTVPETDRARLGHLVAETGHGELVVEERGTAVVDVPL